MLWNETSMSESVNFVELSLLLPKKCRWMKMENAIKVTKMHPDDIVRTLMLAMTGEGEGRRWESFLWWDCPDTGHMGPMLQVSILTLGQVRPSSERVASAVTLSSSVEPVEVVELACCVE